MAEKIYAQTRGPLPGRVLTLVMEKLFYLSLITASISFTLAETKLFKPLRDRVNAKNSLLGELFSCGYCLGHWVALILASITRFRLFGTWWPLDYVLTALVIAWLSAFQWALMCWAMNKIGK